MKHRAGFDAGFLSLNIIWLSAGMITHKFNCQLFRYFEKIDFRNRRNGLRGIKFVAANSSEGSLLSPCWTNIHSQKNKTTHRSSRR